MKTINFYIDGTYYLRLWKFMTYDHLPFQYIINWGAFKDYIIREIKKNFGIHEDIVLKQSSIFFNKAEIINLQESFFSQFSNNNIDFFIQKENEQESYSNQIDLSWQVCKNYYKDPFDYFLILSGNDPMVPIIQGLKREGVKCIVMYIDDFTPTDSSIVTKADYSINFEYIFNDCKDEVSKSIFQRKVLSEIDSKNLENDKDIISKNIVYSSYVKNAELIQKSRTERLKSFEILKAVVLKTRRISSSRIIELEKFCSSIQLTDIDYELIDIVFLHKSYTNKSQAVSKNLELAYIGHDIINTVISVYLYRLNSKSIIDPHEMAIKQRTYKTEENVSIAAKEIKMDKYLLLGKGEDSTGGRSKPTILSGAFASLVGIIFLASGYESAEDFVIKHLLNKLDNKKLIEDKDYKTQLQELCQKLYKETPAYSIEKIEGPDHEQVFWMSVMVRNKTFGPESGNNKRTAAQKVAKIAYDYLRHHNL